MFGAIAATWHAGFRWKRLQTHLSILSPEIQDSLLMPQSSLAISSQEQQLNCCLPNDYKKLYRFSGGQKQSNPYGLWFSLTWLTPEKLYFSSSSADNSSWLIQTPEQIQSPARPEKWLVFAENPVAFLALDYAPTALGSPAQVVIAFKPHNEVFLLADSFGDFIDDFLHRLEDHQIASDQRGQLLPRQQTDLSLLDFLYQELKQRHARCTYR